MTRDDSAKDNEDLLRVLQLLREGEGTRVPTSTLGR
jgi:hypothetical protein